MKDQAILNLLNKKKIIIYGAGKIGKRILHSLRSFGYNIEFFWDKNAEIIEQFDKTPIIKPDFNSIPSGSRKDYIIIITIFAKNISKEISEKLAELGYLNVVHDRKIINTLIYQACSKAIANNKFSFDITTCHICPVPKENNTTCDILDNYIAEHLAKGTTAFSNKKEKLVMAKLGVLVSNKCNLTCKGCNHLRDLYKKGDAIEFTLAEILGDLKKVVDAVDLINQVVLVGGEAFLHAGLYDILEGILKLPKIGTVQIITNGTVKPRDPRLYNLMANERVIVEVSGYGDKIPRALQGNVSDFLSELKKHKVNHLPMNTLQWFDFGDFNERPYTSEQHRQVYISCCFISNDMFNGKIHKCSRSVFASHLKKIPDYADDYVDVRKHSKEQLRTKLFEFLANKWPKVCLHCNGTSTETVEVAAQVHKQS